MRDVGGATYPPPPERQHGGGGGRAFQGAGERELRASCRGCGARPGGVAMEGWRPYRGGYPTKPIRIGDSFLLLKRAGILQKSQKTGFHNLDRFAPLLDTQGKQDYFPRLHIGRYRNLFH